MFLTFSPRIAVLRSKIVLDSFLSMSSEKNFIIVLKISFIQTKRPDGTTARYTQTVLLLLLLLIGSRFHFISEIKSSCLQIWVKTAEVLARDRLLGSYTVSNRSRS